MDLNGQIHGLSALTPGRYLRAHCIGSSVGPLAFLDGSEEEKNYFPFRDSNTGPTSP